MHLTFRKLVTLSLITVLAPALIGCSRSPNPDVAPLAAVATVPTSPTTASSGDVPVEPNQSMTTGGTKAQAIAVAIAAVVGRDGTTS